jgi:hypothetical protein
LSASALLDGLIIFVGWIVIIGRVRRRVLVRFSAATPRARRRVFVGLFLSVIAIAIVTIFLRAGC